MRLRVVGGQLGGRGFRAPPGRTTRPTRDMVREAWFSALGDRLGGARVLDLFAGSGALGIEALSRGARMADFVEADRRTMDLLRRNLDELGLTARSRTFRRDVFAFLGNEEGGGATGEGWDLALADPPYGSGFAARLVERFRRRPFAVMLCVEHPADELEEAGAAWRRRYGDTGLSFFLPPTGGTNGAD